MSALILIGIGLFLLAPTVSRARLTARLGRAAGRGRAVEAAVLLGVGVAVVVGGLVGVASGVAAGLATRWALSRMGSGDGGRSKELARQAPDAVDCLAACLAAGADLWTAMEVVADAFGEPTAGVLRRAVTRHWLGSPHTETFAEMLAEPCTSGIARVLVRSIESGAGVSRALAAGADQMRRERNGELERRARSLGVKAVAPLGLCFLPAFVVVAVVPIVGSLLTGLF
jgi:pilus assembly protein TadC